MKKIRLLLKDIEVKDREGNISIITLKSKDMLKTALESYQDGLKGLSKLRNMLKIYDKLEKANDFLELEDSEFDLFYKAIDNAQWMPIVLRFKEFFEEIENAKK